MLSIIIVSWKNDPQLERCVNSILLKSKYEHEIIVFKNECVKANNIWDNVTVLMSPTNKGLSYGANKAAEIAQGDVLCFIDDDMIMLSGWDVPLVEWADECEMENDNRYWIASTMIEPDPPPWGIKLDEYQDGVKTINGYYLTNSSTPLVLSKSLFKEIGGYDEDFPSIGAELGLAKRAYDAGVKYFIQHPDSLVIHNQSQSIKRLKDKRELRKRRDNIFQKKYGISRKEFTKLIRKGEKYDPTV